MTKRDRLILAARNHKAEQIRYVRRSLQYLRKVLPDYKAPEVRKRLREMTQMTIKQSARSCHVIHNADLTHQEWAEIIDTIQE